MSATDELMRFVAELADLGLVEMPGDGFISSRRMDRNAEYFGKKRAAGRKGGSVAEPRDWREDWCCPECMAAHDQTEPCADCPARRDAHRAAQRGKTTNYPSF